MLPSELMREEISKKYNVDLEKYAWPEQFKEMILSIKLNQDYETSAKTLREIYEHGFNIGRCGLTSRYIARKFEEATLYYGKADLLVGTKSSKNGEHAWTTIEGFLVDSTLMLLIPMSEAVSLGYISEKKLEYKSARMLSEYDIYDNEYEKEKIKKINGLLYKWWTVKNVWKNKWRYYLKKVFNITC